MSIRYTRIHGFQSFYERLVVGFVCVLVISSPVFAAAEVAATDSPAILPTLPQEAPDVLKMDEGSHSSGEAATAAANMTMLRLDGMGSYTNYVKLLHQQLREHWKPKQMFGTAGGRTVVSFEIGHDGAIRQIEVAETSGNKRADELALNAVRSAVPFAPFPKELNIESMVVQYTFDFYKPY